MTTRKRHRCSESSTFRIVRFEPERSVWRTLLAGERLDLPKGDRPEPREGRPPLKSAVGECFMPKRGLPAQQVFGGTANGSNGSICDGRGTRWRSLDQSECKRPAQRPVPGVKQPARPCRIARPLRATAVTWSPVVQRPRSAWSCPRLQGRSFAAGDDRRFRRTNYRNWPHAGHWAAD